MSRTLEMPEKILEFSPSDLSELERHGQLKTFAKGEPLWNAGDTSEAVYLVKEGRANMAIPTADGAPAIVHFCTQAEIFCTAAAISNAPFPCSAVAATDLEVVAVPRSAFMALFGRLPQFAKGLLRQMAPLMCESHMKQATALSPVRARLARLLCSLHKQYQGGQLPFTRQELANMCGTTVETTIRTLSEWEKDGTIRSQRGSLRILRMDELELVSA